jgi:hypothetical protein
LAGVSSVTSWAFRSKIVVVLAGEPTHALARPWLLRPGHVIGDIDVTRGQEFRLVLSRVVLSRVVLSHGRSDKQQHRHGGRRP